MKQNKNLWRYFWSGNEIDGFNELFLKKLKHVLVDKAGISFVLNLQIYVIRRQEFRLKQNSSYVSVVTFRYSAKYIHVTSNAKLLHLTITALTNSDFWKAKSIIIRPGESFSTLDPVTLRHWHSKMWRDADRMRQDCLPSVGEGILTAPELNFRVRKIFFNPCNCNWENGMVCK